MRKYLFILIAAFLLGGCASSKNAVIPVTTHSGPPISEEKRTAADKAVEKWRQWQDGAPTQQLQAPAPAMETEIRPETPAKPAPRSETTPTQPYMTGGAKTQTPVAPPPYRGNPGHGDFATKEDLKALEGKVTGLSRTVVSLDKKVSDLWFLETARTGLSPLRIDFPPNGDSLGQLQNRATNTAATILNGRAKKIAIFSFASEPGDPARNKKLSDNRLKAVVNALAPLLQGVEIVKTQSMGESRLAEFPRNNTCVRIITIE